MNLWKMLLRDQRLCVHDYFCLALLLRDLSLSLTQSHTHTYEHAVDMCPPADQAHAINAEFLPY